MLSCTSSSTGSTTISSSSETAILFAEGAVSPGDSVNRFTPPPLLSPSYSPGYTRTAYKLDKKSSADSCSAAFSNRRTLSYVNITLARTST